MSPDLNYQIARARQAEIASRARQAPGARERHGAVDRPRRSVRLRVTQALAALGVGLAATAALAVTGAQATPRPARANVRLSASQLTRTIHRYETKGYAEYQCTRQGILVRGLGGVLRTISY